VYSGKMSPMNKREETYHMTDKEMARLIVAERLIAGEITIKDAAEVLRLSTRQVKRIKKKVRLNGPGATIHGNRKLKRSKNQKLYGIIHEIFDIGGKQKREIGKEEASTSVINIYFLLN
ncbi:unnamed protein product, partial [marine sediment metagenome]